MAFNPSTKNHKVKLTMPKIMELNQELLAPETNHITINDINKNTFSSTEKTLMVHKTIIPLTFGPAALLILLSLLERSKCQRSHNNLNFYSAQIRYIPKIFKKIRLKNRF